MKRKLSILFMAVVVAAVAFFGVRLTADKDPVQLARDLYENVVTVGVAGASYGDADYTCDGSADDVQAQLAANALPSEGGCLLFLSGNYSFDATVSRAIDDVVIMGVGAGTSFSYNASTAIFDTGSQSNWVFRDFTTDAGGVDYQDSINYSMDNVTLGSTHYSHITQGGEWEIGGINGLDFDAYSDTDIDLVSLNITGSPKIIWDESETSFGVAGNWSASADNTYTIGTPTMGWDALHFYDTQVMQWNSTTIAFRNSTNTGAHGLYAGQGQFSTLIVAQGASDAAIAIYQSTDVTHGMTDIAATDTYNLIVKHEATAGGVKLMGLKDSDATSATGIVLEGAIGIALDTTMSSAGRASVEVQGGVISGSSWGTITADGNLFAVRSVTTSAVKASVFIIDEDGDSWQSGGGTFGSNLIVNEGANPSTFYTTAAYVGLSITSTQDSAGGATLKLRLDGRTTPTVGDRLGMVLFEGDDLNGAVHDFAVFEANPTDMTQDAEHAKFVWKLMNAGSEVVAMELSSIGILSPVSGIELATDKKIQFRDALIYVSSDADGRLDLHADVSIDLNSPNIYLAGSIGWANGAGMTSDAGVGSAYTLKAWKTDATAALETVATISNSATTGTTYIGFGGSSQFKFYNNGSMISSGFSYYQDDVVIFYGAGQDAGMLYETADGNAKALMIALPHVDEDGDNVPLLVVGDIDILGVDLGMFNGYTQPHIGLIDVDRDSYLAVGHSTDDIPALSSNNIIVFRPNGDNDDYIKLATPNHIPSIYGVGAYLRIGDVAATSHSLNAEDDLMVSGELEVDGSAWFDGHLYINGESTVEGTEKIYWRDSAIYIGSINDTFLDLEADGAIRLNADTLVAGSGKLYFSDEGGEYIHGDGSVLYIVGASVLINGSAPATYDNLVTAIQDDDAGASLGGSTGYWTFEEITGHGSVYFESAIDGDSDVVVTITVDGTAIFSGLPTNVLYKMTIQFNVSFKILMYNNNGAARNRPTTILWGNYTS